MDSSALFSSPPRRAPSSLEMREVSRSGGPSSGRTHERYNGRRPDYRNLSRSSRAARANEEPWRTRFRQQCLDRLSSARDQSIMMRRQLSQLAQNNQRLDENTMQQNQEQLQQKQQLDGHDLVYLTDENDVSEQDMYNIVQQEWARFRNEMEEQSLEYGVLDEGILEDLEEDLSYSRRYGDDDMNMADESQFDEYADWERYENQVLEEQMIEEELMRADIDMSDL
ncbi:hypothetical protein LPJ64_000694 [Coemansia asiatica]|uniref:Uncharacterized protein n=1 Tax=Coemansia asiatica TaxID=1052880 RepID=A0A9W7XQE2_9FUNG|nr:hypothetical protein LPJ64_000694 [Coemansia asiatica]